jgi:uncharacterized protein YjbI with pentapeptide repeats
MSDVPPRPTSQNDHEGWKGYWTAQGMTWRTEPEIDQKRQDYLARQRNIAPDIPNGLYPFKGIRLGRADVEWLLATHAGGGLRGPVDLRDELHRNREGIDLRGADVRRVDLSNLPLSGVQAGLLVGPWSFDGYIRMVLPQPGETLTAFLDAIEAAAINAADANFSGAHLEHAALRGAHMEGAILSDALLQDADLVVAHLERTQLDGAHLENAWLPDANLEHARFSSKLGEVPGSRPAYLTRAWLSRAHLVEADLAGVHMEGANLMEAHAERAFFTQTHAEGVWATWIHCEGAYFNEAHFEATNLSGAHLEGAYLRSAHFEGAGLSEAHLQGAQFIETHLEGSWLIDAHLEAASLQGAHCEGRLVPAEQVDQVRRWEPKFTGRLTPAKMSGAFFDSATVLKDVTLGTAEYGGVWLADVRWGDANLSVVPWSQVTVVGEEHEARQPLTVEGIPKTAANRLEEYQAAVRTNRQLATALRGQGLNEQADHFAYRAFALERKVLRKQKQSGKWLFSWMLAILSGYGYRLRRILVAYVLILLVFTMLYWLLGVHSSPQASGLRVLWDSFLVSLSAIHGRTTFEQLGAWSPAAWVAAIESVVGIVIEGVFIAMLVQRFFSR